MHKRHIKEVLMTPGPVTVPAMVLKEFSRPLIFHRYADFQELYGTVTQQLLRVFKGSREHKCVVFTGSGTSANESILSSAYDGNDKVLVVSNGDFGERLATILKLHRVPISRYRLKPFHSIDPSEVLHRALVEKVTAVAMVAMETSTGMINPVKDVGLLIKRQTRKAVSFFVDGVSALGCEPIEVTNWGISYCTSVPNKAIEAPPGISFACVNTADYFKRKRVPTSYYLDLSRYLTFGAISQTPTTPSISHLRALSKALEMLGDETLSGRRARYHTLTEQLINKLKPLGFVPVLGSTADRSAAVTAFAIPKPIRAATLNEYLRRQGFVLWFPQSSKTINRVEIMLTSVMGNVKRSHIQALVRAIERFMNAIK